MPMAREREYRALQDFTFVTRENETDAYRVRGTAVVFDTPTYLYEIEIDGIKFYEVIDLLKNSQQVRCMEISLAGGKLSVNTEMEKFFKIIAKLKFNYMRIIQYLPHIHDLECIQIDCWFA